MHEPTEVSSHLALARMLQGQNTPPLGRELVTRSNAVVFIHPDLSRGFFEGIASINPKSAYRSARARCKVKS
jgi:hypothetical protein